MNIHSSLALHELNQHHHQVHRLQAEYREAIRLNKEFQEVKKIYNALKRLEQQVHAQAQKNHH